MVRMTAVLPFQTLIISFWRVVLVSSQVMVRYACLILQCVTEKRICKQERCECEKLFR